jgi:nicotinic acid mononucleotide adenylyltransferase
MLSARIYIAATGAGARTQDHIWQVPGCSAAFAGACFPYANDQLVDFLGHTPPQFCSQDTAIEMATMAYYRAWVPGGPPAVGVGLSAAVASAAPRRGENRIHGAVMTDAGVTAMALTLGHEYGAEARAEHGVLADEMIMQLVDRREHISEADTSRATALFLANGYWATDGTRSALPPRGRAMYPGAFNPPHAGHLELADITDAVFWVEAQAPNKPVLPLSTMVQRAKLLKGRDRFFTSGYPLYTDKSKAFPHRIFVVGADAIERMFDPKWGPSVTEVAEVLKSNGTILAIGRRRIGDIITWSESVVPRAVSIHLLHNNNVTLSSSAIRASAEQKPPVR